MKVPFVDLTTQYLALRTEFATAIDRVCSTSQFILGDELKAFEVEFAQLHESQFAIGVSSGLEALALSLMALGIGPGDDVLIPANTFIATALAVTRVGARPVLVDIDRETHLIDLNRCEAALTPKTKAVMPVHLYGQPADMTEILQFASGRKLHVIEDACQAHGARYQGKRIGALGSVGAFSFYPAKNIGAFGDGGAVVTNQESIATAIAQHRHYGQGQRYQHLVKGTNARLDTVQAAVLRIKLKKLDQWNQHRMQHARRYMEGLRELRSIRLPVAKPDRDHIFHLFVIETERRDELIAWLAKHEIQSGIHYPTPIHLQPAYQELGYRVGDFPRTEAAAKQIVSLPMYPELANDQIDFVVEQIREFCRV